MQITDAEYADALTLGFKPYWHKLSGFAEACYNMNRYTEIKNCLTADVDESDCKEWDIDADDWREAQKHAIELAMAEHDDQ